MNDGLQMDSVHSQLGTYHLLRLLGRGTSSEVYFAEQSVSHMSAAVKILHGYSDATEVQRFLARASVLAHIRHPNIVQVLDYGIEGANAFLVMDYAPYGTLRQRHPRGTRLPLETILFYVKPIASALQYVHHHRLIHRDIKPHNLLLGPSDTILLSDFGIAVVSQSHVPVYPTFDDFEGTAPYAAPEQLQGKPRRSSDQYSLAVVVYEWLSGQWPFSGSFDQVVQQHLFTPPPPFREKGVEVHPAVEAVVVRALAKAPEQRFPTIEDFARALEAAMHKDQHTPSSNLQLRGQFKSPLPFSKDT